MFKPSVFGRFVLILAAFAVSVPLRAGDAESRIQSVLNVQIEAWNRGDIPTFVGAYAPDCIFVGKQVAHGRAQLLARYQRTYPTREAMGHLTFGSLEVRLLTPDVAIVTGAWHVERSGAGGTPVGGLFSLVFHREGKEWKIALDHTS